MPTYQFKNTETGEIIEKFMKISEMGVFTKDKIWEVYHGGSANIVSAVNEFGSHTSRAMAKDGGWNELLSSIKKNHPYMKFKD